MMLKSFIIIPNPKEFYITQGFCNIKEFKNILIPNDEKHDLFPTAKRIKQILNDTLKIDLSIRYDIHKTVKNNIIFEKKNDLPKEGYIIEIINYCILIKFGDNIGAYHAISTLKQIVQQNKENIPCLLIRDNPDFEARGILLDISRNKIPKMETLYELVDFMSDLKMNQLQLYIEGFSFAYPSFPDVWKNQTPVTGEEILMLDRYCSSKFIELVPNQNSFGHMASWLEREEFNDMAECPHGFSAPWGWQEKPLCLNPINPKCLNFIAITYDDLLPYFSSNKFNVGCDETFELGQGNSKQICDKLGKGRVYYDYLMKINELANKRGKQMMFWGDIILHYPELISELPKDVIALEWGYREEQPLEEHCERFNKSGIPYYVCPGTSSWNSITGLFDNMKSNLLNAAIRGKKHGAIGYLNTDWGDGGHWQHLCMSYPSFSYGAALSWGVEQNKNIDIVEYLDTFVFHDNNKKMGQIALKIGNYYLKEKDTIYNGSGIFRTLCTSQLNDKNTELDFLNLPDLDIEDFQAVKNYILPIYDELCYTNMQCKDSINVKEEFENSLMLILHGSELGLYKSSKYNNDEKQIKLAELIENITIIIENFKILWLQKNRPGGLDQSLERLEELKFQYCEALNLLHNPT